MPGSRDSWRALNSTIAAIVIIVLIIAGVLAYFSLYSQPKSGKAELRGVIRVGFTASLSGKYSEVGEEFLEGLELWAKWANQTGINYEGQKYGVKLYYYDDKSDPEQVQALYEKLVKDDKVDYLISPPIDVLARPAIQVAEQYRKIIIVTAPEESLFRSGLKYSYQIATPASRYFTAVLDIAKEMDPNSTRIAIIAIDTTAARSMASGVKLWASQNGYQVVFEYYYPPGTKDFTSTAITVAAKAPDIIVGGGGIEETIALVKALYDAGVRPKLVALLDGPLRDEFASKLGEIAVGIMGVSEWEVYASYSPFAAKQLNLTWYGPSLTEFITMYNSEYNESPTYATGLGFAAGLVLQYGIEHANPVSTARVIEALDNANILTLYGVIKFDTTPEIHGLQIGHQPLVVQWIEKGGEIQKVVVAPKEFATAEPLYPLPWG